MPNVTLALARAPGPLPLMPLTVDWHRCRSRGRGHRIEDHATDPINARRRSSGLDARVHSVGRAHDGDPVGDAVGVANDAAGGRSAARDAERQRDRVGCEENNFSFIVQVW